MIKNAVHFDYSALDDIRCYIYLSLSRDFYLLHHFLPKPHYFFKNIFYFFSPRYHQYYRNIFRLNISAMLFYF